jgi:hypothetical protein
MKDMKRIVCLAVLLVGAATLVGAQSLAEVAAKEKKRRQAVEGSGKVITNDDLGRGRRPGAESTQAAAETPSTPQAEGDNAAASEKPEAPEKTDAELREEKRAEIQAKIDEQKKLIEERQKKIDEAQAELNDLSDMTFGNRRGGLMQTVEEGNAEIAKSRQAIEDLREQARRAGVRVSTE